MEAAVRQRRLPGVYFEVIPRPIRDPLPRMDVAAFVGFAAAGPTDVPVPVEDVQQFRDVFGPRLLLLSDDGEGRPVFAQLYPAVELFFRNGGRKCWVVRVARDPHVRRFRLPGVVAAARGLPVQLRARSGGTWADGLRAHTVLTRQRLDLVRFEGTPARLTLHFAGPPSDFSAGDLLQIFPGLGLQAFVTAEETGETGETGAAVAGTPHWFFQHNPVLTEGVAVQVAVASPTGTRALPAAELIHTGEERTPYLVRWSTALADPPVPGDVIHAAITEPLHVHDGRRVWLAASEVHPSPAGAELAASDALWPVRPGSAAIRDLARASAETENAAYRLRFDVYATGESLGVQRVMDLAFSDFEMQRRAGTEPVQAGRFFGNLPDDDELFGARAQGAQAPLTSLAREVLSPRFGFASGRPEARVFVPLGMASAFRPGGGSPPEPLEGDARARSSLARNGLDAPLPELFLDDEMARQSTAALEARIFDRLYVRKQALRGLHALWPLEEVATAAVPDAAHEGFEWEPGGLPELLDAPHLEDPAWIPEAGTLRLEWTLPDGEDIRFEVHASNRPDFSGTPERFRTADRRLELRVAGCSEQRYFRVRARRGTEVGPWSNTVRLFSPPVPFERCRATLGAPVVSLIRDMATHTFSARWSAVEHADDYELVTSSDVEMLSAEAASGTRQVHVSDGETFFTQDLGRMDASAPLYVRVRATAGGEPGPWSRTLRIDPATRPSWRLRRDPEAAQADLLSIHRALIRMCGVRADCFAVLGLPKSFEHEAALGYVTALRGGEPGSLNVPPIRPDEERMFSYAGLYHPWAVSAIDGGDPIDVGADGIAAGMYAFRTLRRGAWVAPAEMDLRGLLGVVDQTSDEERISLREAHVNALIRGAGRFVFSGAQTLSFDAEWDQVNVRRLMILLRRVLLREGNLFVFDSNDDELRRRIAVRLDQTFTDLFRRGAFAGRTVDEAFRIDASRSLNTPDEIDRGRLLVEIRVAPSRPLVFLIIRLVQRELEGLQIAEV